MINNNLILIEEPTETLWNRAYQIIVEASSSPERTIDFLGSAVVEHIDSQSIVLSFPNTFIKNIVDRSYVKTIEDALFGLTNNIMNITTLISSKKTTVINTPIINDNSNPPLQQNMDISQKKKNHNFNNRFTFNSFVVGESNSLAYGAAYAVAQQPHDHYPMLFIYGRSGLGKTHLLCAINNYLDENYPYLDTLYFTGKNLVEDIAQRSINKSWLNFDKKYNEADVLLIDDIQFLEGKKESTELVFQLLNDSIMSNKQIVLCADRAPKDINMDERMTSRFMKGLVVDVQPPTFETKLAILKNYQNLYIKDVTISDDILTYIAEISSSNIREIEGAIFKVESYATLTKNNNLTVDKVRDILKDFFPEKNSKYITIQIIQSEVEKYFGITHEEMVCSKRERRLNNPRQIAMYLSRTLTEESYPSIGKRFGNRDHTTIINGVRQIEKQMKENRELYDQLEKLSYIIKDKV